MPTRALSTAELEQLKAGLRNLAPAGAAAAPQDDIETEFCTIWPKAEPILKIVAQYIVFIPGVGTAAGAIINGLVTAGDTLANTVCPKT